MSCYFGAEACARGHIADCPGARDVWAEETKPRATPMPAADDDGHDWMGIAAGRGGIQCESCGLWLHGPEDPRWLGKCTPRVGAMVLSANGSTSGWRRTSTGWVKDA